MESNQASGYAPHYSANRSNAEYGIIPAPSMVESSFESRVPNPTSLNYSNVQIVCRINAPNKAPQQTSASKASAIRRPNSASRISFNSAGGIAFKGKESSHFNTRN